MGNMLLTSSKEYIENIEYVDNLSEDSNEEIFNNSNTLNSELNSNSNTNKLEFMDSNENILLVKNLNDKIIVLEDKIINIEATTYNNLKLLSDDIHHLFELINQTSNHQSSSK